MNKKQHKTAQNARKQEKTKNKKKEKTAEESWKRKDASENRRKQKGTVGNCEKKRETEGANRKLARNRWEMFSHIFIHFLALSQPFCVCETRKVQHFVERKPYKLNFSALESS